MANLFKYPFTKLDINSDTFQDWFNNYNSLLDFLDSKRDLEPSITGSDLTVTLNEGWVHLPNGPKYYPQTNIDLSSYLPISNKKYVLIGIDYLGDFVVREGAESNTPSYPDGSGIASICLVLLSPSMTTLSDEDVQDVRSVVGFSGTGSSGSSTSEVFKYYDLLRHEPFSKLFYDDFFNESYIYPNSLTGNFNLQKTQIELDNGEYFTTVNLITTPTDYVKVFIDAKDLDNIKIEYSIDNRQTFTQIERETLTNVSINDNFYLRFTSLIDGNELYSYALLYDFQGESYYAKGKLYEVYTAQNDLPAGTNIIIPNNKHYTNNGVSLIVHDNTGKRWISGQDYTEINDTTIQIQKPLSANQQLIFEEYYSTINDEINNVLKDKFWISNAIFDSSVSNNDVVYENSDGKFYLANLNNIKGQNVIGIADVTNNRVLTYGLIEFTNTFTPGENLYLSKTDEGKITNEESSVKIGVVISNNLIYFKPEIVNYNTIFSRVDFNYTTQNEKIIGVDTSSNNLTITLASSDVYAGKEIIIKDIVGSAVTHPITVQTEGSETIDGEDSVIINTNYGKLHLISDGNNWFIV